MNFRELQGLPLKNSVKLLVETPNIELDKQVKFHEKSTLLARDIDLENVDFNR